MTTLDAIIALDKKAFLAANHALSSPALGFIFDCVTRVGEAYFAGAMACLLLLLYDRKAFRSHAPWLIGAMIIGGMINSQLKDLFERQRPLKEFAPMISAGETWVNVVGPRLYARSFPSGHAQTAFSAFTYVALACRTTPFIAGSLVTAFLIAVSRIAVGAHFPLDLAAGAIVGSSCATAAWFMRKKVAALFEKKPS